MGGHTIAVRDNGGEGKNGYRLVFSGDSEPTFAAVHGATPSPNAAIHQNDAGEWVVSDAVWGGTDAWTYSGRKVRLAFRTPGNVDIRINDGDWNPASAYDSTDTLGNGSAAAPGAGSPDAGNGGSAGDTDTSSDTDTADNSTAGWGPHQPPADPSDDRWGSTGDPAREDGDPAVTYPNGVGNPGSYTTEPMYRYIDPVDGDDTWPGTKTDPLATIGEFVQRLPSHALHGVRGLLKKGRYEEGAIHFPHKVHKELGDGGQHDGFMIGPAVDPDEGLPQEDVEDHVIESVQIGTRLDPYAIPGEMGFHDVTIEGCVQNRWGTTALRRCVLDPTANYYNVARGADTYGGTVFLWDCHVRTTPETHHFANSAQQGTLALRRCSADDPKHFDSVIGLGGTDRRFVIDEGGNDLGPRDGWFE